MTPSRTLIRWTRHVLLSVAVLATMVAAGYVEEDWRGQRDWRRVEASHAARNDSLRLGAYLGPAVPDNVNIFKAPAWAALTSEHTPAAERSRALAASGLTKIGNVAAMGDSKKALEDVRRVMIAKGLLAKDDSRPVAQAVLAGLQPVAEFCDALRVAARERPAGAALSEPPLYFSDLRIGEVYEVAKLFAFRAQVELAAGKPNEAFDDVLTLLRIARACEFNPATIMQSLVAIAMASRADDVLQQACATHAWSGDQLARLQTAYGELKLSSYLTTAFRSERNWQLAVIDQLRSLDLNLVRLGSRSERRKLMLARWVPRGWLDENKVVLCRRYERDLSVLDALGTPEYPRALAQLNTPDFGDCSCPIVFLGGARGKAFVNVIKGAAVDLEAIDGAMIALGLERHYQAHGRYPGTLGALVPEFLAIIPPRSDGSAFPYTPAHDGSHFELQRHR